MLCYCWTDVQDGGPTLKQHWINVSCFLGTGFLSTSQHIIVCSTYCGLPILLTARLAAPEVADRDLAESVLSSNRMPT